jgi:hypothetical protein
MSTDVYASEPGQSLFDMAGVFANGAPAPHGRFRPPFLNHAIPPPSVSVMVLTPLASGHIVGATLPL